MVHLLLSEPDWKSGGNDEAVRQQISMLSELESTIWTLITSGGRSEARLWLCRSLSTINSITPACQRELFVKLLRSRPLKEGLADQVLRMIFEKQPQKAGHIIAKKSYLLEDFFRGKLDYNFNLVYYIDFLTIIFLFPTRFSHCCLTFS